MLAQKLFRFVPANFAHLSKIANGSSHQRALRRKPGQVRLNPFIEARLGQGPLEVREQDDLAAPIPGFDVIVPTLAPFALLREKAV